MEKKQNMSKISSKSGCENYQVEKVLRELIDRTFRMENELKQFDN